MKENKLVSVIVPIYNVEPYLVKCIQSILCQTYKNIELILVDDGSPDNCGAICDYYAAIDERVIVIHKENDGVSNARNSGIEIAKGDYIYFIDADDYAEKEAIEVLVSIAENESADLVIAEINIVDELDSERIVSNNNLYETNQCFNSYQAVDFFIQKDWGPWNKLYARHVHDNVKFPSHKIHEDEAIMLELLHNCEKIIYTQKRLYNYLKRNGSTTSAQYSIKKMDWFDAWRDNVDYISIYYPTLKSKALSKLVITAIYNYNNLINLGKCESELTIIRECLSKHIIQIIKSKFIKCTYKLRVALVVYNPRLYQFVYKKLLKRC